MRSHTMGCRIACLLVLMGGLALAAPPAQADDAAVTTWGPTVAPVVDPLGGPQPVMTRRTSGWCAPVPEGCCPTDCLPNPLTRIPCVDDCWDQYQAAKEKSCLQLGAGAYHWFNYQNESDEFTYGYPGAEGTYFFALRGDLTCDGPCCGKVGAHIEARFRDDSPFRSFFDEQVWLYEAYAFYEFHNGARLKVGKVWRRFGLDWDASFWGNVNYYNGQKLDPDWMISYEHTYTLVPRLTVDVFAQFLLGEDEVNGSIAGGDAESSDIYDEELGGNVRVVPTWHFDTKTKLALGLSGHVQDISSTIGSNETATAFAVDLTFDWCGLKAYAEYATHDGTVHEAHYVTGGPSDTKDILLVGAQYTFGAFTPRVTYSHGEYKNPGGEEDMLVAGVDVRLTNWLTFTFEYVDWTVKPDGGAEAPFEDGLQFVFSWNI